MTDKSAVTLEDFFFPFCDLESKVCTDKNLALRTRLFRILSNINGDVLAEMMGGNMLAFWLVPGIGKKGLDFLEDRLEELDIAPWQLNNRHKHKDESGAQN